MSKFVVGSSIFALSSLSIVKLSGITTKLNIRSGQEGDYTFFYHNHTYSKSVQKTFSFLTAHTQNILKKHKLNPYLSPELLVLLHDNIAFSKSSECRISSGIIFPVLSSNHSLTNLFIQDMNQSTDSKSQFSHKFQHSALLAKRNCYFFEFTKPFFTIELEALCGRAFTHLQNKIINTEGLSRDQLLNHKTFMIYNHHQKQIRIGMLGGLPSDENISEEMFQTRSQHKKANKKREQQKSKHEIEGEREWRTEDLKNPPSINEKKIEKYLKSFAGFQKKDEDIQDKKKKLHEKHKEKKTKNQNQKNTTPSQTSK
jgi:hypothetical protein